MEHPTKLFAGAMRPGDRMDNAPLESADWRAAENACRELHAIGMPRVNLLLTGRPLAIEYLLNGFEIDFAEPITSWDPGEPLVLPLVEGGTIFLRNVGAMPLDDQQRLLQWLNAAMGRTQVISTTTRSLIGQVLAGDFNDTLYYRLNTVSVDVTI
jgi:hypothetical protein